MGKSLEVPESLAKETPGRKDRGCRHVVRGSILSRSLIQTLERRGENVRALRRMESELRAALKPQGALGRLLFDRFWASILRSILVTQLEEAAFAPQGSASRTSVSVPSLREGAVPILVLPPEDEWLEQNQEERNFDSEVFRRLALVSRYDRAAGREMYRTLDRLLLMRDGGKRGLESLASAIAGIKPEDRDEDKEA